MNDDVTEPNGATNGTTTLRDRLRAKSDAVHIPPAKAATRRKKNMLWLPFLVALVVVLVVFEGWKAAVLAACCVFCAFSASGEQSKVDAKAFVEHAVTVIRSWRGGA